MAPIIHTAAITSSATSSYSPTRSRTESPTGPPDVLPPSSSNNPRNIHDSLFLQRVRRLSDTRNGTIPGELPADHEIDAIVARISAKHAVRGVIVIDVEKGGIIRSSMIDTDGGGVILGKNRTRSGESSVEGSIKAEGNEGEEEGDSDLVAKYATICVQFVKTADEVVGQFFEEDDDLKLLRLRTKEHELMIVPDPRFILAVIHDVHAK
ncbi:hypothetical protein POJ06DRAFT_93034 [Lipomyces tetrasporus]|uniref:Roadblock/LAMTOR2 domain-containing protein n=1 Tax=Lipomyces tetrasporus TaxID=54092 RepID=A0AAD7VTZ7_9ASCO|nr:uncharacterized protein POJ06DRAFT_93034 [Lipomyces tetrasporus]KAJ8101274.1 hypothetical protein POJ06DRAFT_93034 [Lipomyces tetrasporus]